MNNVPNIENFENEKDYIEAFVNYLFSDAIKTIKPPVSIEFSLLDILKKNPDGYWVQNIIDALHLNHKQLKNAVYRLRNNYGYTITYNKGLYKLIQ